LTARLSAIAVAALATTIVTRGHTPDTAPTPQNHDMTLSGARLSESSGRRVVTLVARGDLRGLVTLTLDVGPDGAVTGGDWALVVAHIQDLNPDGSPAETVEEAHDDHEEPADVPVEEHHDEPSGGPHQEFIRFVNRGTLGGHVVGGFIGAATNGAVALINVQLQLTSATLTFASARSGTGSIDADLGRDHAQGSLRLSF
jgi:hypothetical protein